MFEEQYTKEHPAPKPQPTHKVTPGAAVSRVMPAVSSRPGIQQVQPQQVITTQPVTYAGQQGIVRNQTIITRPQQTIVSAPQQQTIITGPTQHGVRQPVVIRQLAGQPQRTGSPITLTQEQLQALQRSGSPVTIVRKSGSPAPVAIQQPVTHGNVIMSAPQTTTQGNVIYTTQSVAGTPASQAKKITVIRTTPGGGVQKVIAMPPGGNTSQVVSSGVAQSPGVSNVVRQAIDSNTGKKVHVVTLSPKVLQTSTGPKKVTITKVQHTSRVPQNIVQASTPTVIGNGPQTILKGATPIVTSSTPVQNPGRIVQNPSGQRFTVTRTSDGQIQIVRPAGVQVVRQQAPTAVQVASQQSSPAIVQSPGLIQHPTVVQQSNVLDTGQTRIVTTPHRTVSTSQRILMPATSGSSNFQVTTPENQSGTSRVISMATPQQAVTNQVCL